MIPYYLNPLRAIFKKWSNTLKQFIRKLPTNRLSVFDHFVGLVLKGLKTKKRTKLERLKKLYNFKEFCNFYSHFSCFVSLSTDFLLNQTYTCILKRSVIFLRNLYDCTFKECFDYTSNDVIVQVSSSFNIWISLSRTELTFST